MGSRSGSDDEDEDVYQPPQSPTPIRINNRTREYPSPSSSPHKRSRIQYGDRYIPSRSGVNLQAAFSLVRDQVSSPKPRRPQSNELDFQRIEEANRTFSTLLKAELFGDDVPSAAVSQNGQQLHSNIASTKSSMDAVNVNSSMGTSPAGAGAQANASPSLSTTVGRGTGAGAGGGSSSASVSASTSRTPPRTSSSAPVTPNKNLFRYQSPSRSTMGNYTDGRSIPKARYIADANNDIYSLSPVRMDSQRLLLSPRKQTRSIAKVPYKVLDAPELADDFYLNLVDWGSKNLLAVGLAGAVYLWHAQSGAVNKMCDLNENDKVTSISWMKSGTHLAIGTNQGMVQIWDAEHQKKIRQMTGHNARAGSLAWNEHLLTSGSRDRTILHRDVRIPDHYIKRLSGHRQEVCGLKWNTEENQLASGSNDNRLFVWDYGASNPLHKFEHVAAVKAIAWSPHQRGLLASGGGTADRRIRFWNTSTGNLLNEIDTGSQVCNLAWSKNSNELVSTHGYSQNQIMVWKYPSMQQVAALTGHTYRVLYLTVSPDGRTVVTGAGDETLRFWNVFDENKGTTRPSSSLLDVFQQLR